jgi:hypothetical protein
VCITCFFGNCNYIFPNCFFLSLANIWIEMDIICNIIILKFKNSLKYSRFFLFYQNWNCVNCVKMVVCLGPSERFSLYTSKQATLSGGLKDFKIPWRILDCFYFTNNTNCACPGLVAFWCAQLFHDPGPSGDLEH